MPTKHIPDHTWRKVEKATVKAVLATQKPVKDSDMLNYLILKGLSATQADNWQDFPHIDSQK